MKFKLNFESEQAQRWAQGQWEFRVEVDAGRTPSVRVTGWEQVGVQDQSGARARQGRRSTQVEQDHDGPPATAQGFACTGT